MATLRLSVAIAFLLTPSLVWADLSDGLVAYYPFNGNANDESGSGNTGSVQGPVLGSDRCGFSNRAYQFDGIDDFITCGNDPVLDIAGANEVWSLAGWIRFSDSGNQYFLTKNLTDASIGWNAGTNAGRILGRLDSAGAATNSYNLGTTETFNDGEWHHFVIGWDSASAVGLTIHVDGQERATSVIAGWYSPGENYNTTGSLLIGRAELGQYFPGELDDLRVYDRALTAEEIAELLNDPCGDLDGDGFPPPVDCDDTDPLINPNALELVFNFVDENCDGDLGECDPCAEWQNHGAYVRCVAQVVGDCSAHNFTPEEANGMVNSAAMSDIGKSGFIPGECQ